MKHRRLQELDRSDFEIKDGEPDIRGWDVKNSDNEKIGEVEELIIDAQQQKVRYMVVDMDDNDFDVDDKKILVPIGLASLHEKDDDVIIPTINAEQLRSLPEYNSDQLTPEVEQRICSIFGRQTIPNTSSSARKDNADNVADDKSISTEDDFYQHEYYHTDNLYKQRLHELEEVKKEKKDESEYDKGLKLWEKRSSGGILEGKRSESESSRSEAGNYSEIDEEARLQMVKSRRENYQSRRYTDEGRSAARKKNIIDRTKEEGLQDG